MLPVEQVVNEVKAFDGNGANSLTLYLAGSLHRDASAMLEPQLTDLVRRVEARSLDPARARTALEADLRAMRDYVARLDTTPRGLALFSCAERGFFRAVASAVRFRPRVSWSEHFDLRPLLAALAEHDRVLILLLDKEKARFFRAALEEIEEFEDLWDYLPRKQAQGELGAHEHAEPDHEMHVLLHLRHAVDALTRMDAREPARRILVGGPGEVVAAFERFLPKHVRPRVYPCLHLPVCSTPARVLEVVREANRMLERESEERLVAEIFAEGTARAALGPAPVLEAVNERRARTLVLAESARLPGGECPSCGLVFADPLPPACPVCAGSVHHLEDALVALADAVLRQDGTIQEVRETAARKLETHGGIAARLRYPRPRALTA